MLKGFDKLPKNFGRFVKQQFYIIVSERMDDYGIRPKYFRNKKEKWPFTITIKKILKGFLIGFITFLVIDIIVFIICFFGHYRPF